MRTPLLLALLAVCSACAASARPAPAPDAAAVTVAPAAAAEPDPGEPIRICVFQNGELAELAARYMPHSGDTLVDGRPFAEAHPVTAPPYAAAAEWYVRHEPLVVGTGRFARKAKYGLPRVIQPEQLQRIGDKHGVPLYAEAGEEENHAVVYVLVRPGCVFHAIPGQPHRRRSPRLIAPSSAAAVPRSIPAPAWNHDPPSLFDRGARGIAGSDLGLRGARPAASRRPPRNVRKHRGRVLFAR
jgi:hypothetical protein